MDILTDPFTSRLLELQGQEIDNEQSIQPSFDAKQPLQPSADPFIERLKTNNDKEPWYKAVSRSLLQIPAGIAQAVTFPLDLLSLLAKGDALDPDTIENIRKVSFREGIPFDEEKYLQAVQRAEETFPTQSNIERDIENATGLPLQPKNKLQKGLRFASSIGKASPGTLSQKVIGGTAGATTSQGLQEIGVPEPIANIVGGAAGIKTSQVSPKISIETAKKPSGLTTRRFEKTKKTTEVTPARFQKINEKVEKDFRDITDKIISESSAEKTHASLKSDPLFQKKIAEDFGTVEELSKKVIGSTETNSLKNGIKKLVDKKTGTGLSPSEYEANYSKFMNKFKKTIKEKPASANDLLVQFRKNNKELSSHFESSKSGSYNAAKKDALIDYNSIISDTIEKQYPNSEFSKWFKTKNKQWSEIKGLETMDRFIEDLFEGKVNFKKGQKFYNNQFKKSFERTLGKKSYKEFETLMDDLMSTQRSHALIKKAGSKGIDDLGKNAIHYMISPGTAKAKLIKNHSKSAFQMLLDKPQLTIKWDKAVKLMKQEKFKEANVIFKDLEKQRLSLEESRKESLKKFNEKISKNQ